MNDQTDDGHYEQQVNQPARNVEGKKARKPRYQQHDKENEKHTDSLPFTYYSSGSYRQLPAPPLLAAGRCLADAAGANSSSENIPSLRHQAQTTPREQAIWFPCLTSLLNV
jgi:hypothetical protein